MASTPSGFMPGRAGGVTPGGRIATHTLKVARARLSEAGEITSKPMLLGPIDNLWVSTRNLGEAVEVRVRDNGTGIAPDIRDQLFQPFFTTKPTGEGTGLRLSISWDIVAQQHGGSIEVDRPPGKFTEFTIRRRATVASVVPHQSTMPELRL